MKKIIICSRQFLSDNSQTFKIVIMKNETGIFRLHLNVAFLLRNIYLHPIANKNLNNLKFLNVSMTMVCSMYESTTYVVSRQIN